MDIYKTRLETTRKNKRKENNHTCLILDHYFSMISELNDTRLFNPNVMLCVRNIKQHIQIKQQGPRKLLTMFFACSLSHICALAHICKSLNKCLT